MRIIDCQAPGFDKALSSLVVGIHQIPKNVMQRAEKIFQEVASKGDSALFGWTNKLEKHRVSKKTVKVGPREMIEALGDMPGQDLKVIRLAAKRIRAFHRKQAALGFRFDDGKGTVIEERVMPLDRVGICIPGGRAPLASTVLMTAIPATLAGVKEIIMISPWPEGRMNPHVLAAAQIAGVDEVYKVGGIQGVAALACGTQSIPRTDKIVGPGSIWVAAAKTIAASRGLCGIDLVAGPSEIVVVADGMAKPGLAAIDLLSQAEHGLDSIAVLVTTSRKLADKVQAELLRAAQESGIPKRELKGVFAVLVRNLEQAARVVNEIAPEHLEVMVRQPRQFAKKVFNAASIFLGPYSPVPAGDYMAGANHVLPTGGTARFSSPLGVHDFVKRQSITELSPEALKSISRATARFAEIEGLPAHARAIRKRFPE